MLKSAKTCDKQNADKPRKTSALQKMQQPVKNALENSNPGHSDISASFLYNKKEAISTKFDTFGMFNNKLTFDCLKNYKYAMCFC